jgi:hypothetical protein
MIHKILHIRLVWLLVLYALTDIVCVGMGMGVPIFCILFGFIVGWLAVGYVTTTTSEAGQVLAKTFKAAAITAGFTFLAMLALWGPFSSYLFSPSKDLANTGIPMILYEPRASLIGWIVLMVFISPFLQLLTTLFSAYIATMSWIKKSGDAQKAI